MNLDFIDTEVLVVQPSDANGYYNVVSVSYGNTLAADSRYKAVRASRLALDIAKNALKAGKAVSVPAKVDGPEVRPVDVVISDAGDELTVAKRVLSNEINAAIGQNSAGATAVDVFGFLTAFSRLADHGVFITDENREEKYFEVIDKAQQTEAPADLPEGASYADEQAYLDKKRKYAFAQSTLEALEQYLVSYDKIKSMYSFDKKLREMAAEADAAQTVEEVEAVRAKFEPAVGGMFAQGK